MKITKRQLKRIIREEYRRVLNELGEYGQVEDYDELARYMGGGPGVPLDEQTTFEMVDFIISLINPDNPEGDEMLDYVDSGGIFDGGLYFIRKLKERWPDYTEEDYRAAMQQYNDQSGGRLIDDPQSEY